MTLTVSVSELRSNVSDYLARAIRGTRVLIRDEKKKKTIAQLTCVSAFDAHTYEQALKKAAGIFTFKNHPEWKARRDVTSWVHKGRLADERIF